MTYRDPTPIDPNKDYQVEELAKFIREKMHGKDTREAMAMALEKAGEVAEWSREVAQQIVDGSFDEGALNTEIERKLNELEIQYAPELNNVKMQLAETPNYDYVDMLISNIVSGAPKGTFLTLESLETEYPNGAEGVFLVLENESNASHVYYWNGAKWEDAGIYQSSGLASVMTTQDAPWEVA